MPRCRTTVLVSLAALLCAGGARAAEPEPRPAGDPRRGEALFTGGERFANLGAPCLACHGISGHGLARAASFGPDLSAVYASYGAEALDGALADMPFPTMAPLYAKHTVTAGERADLAAFLRDASGREPPRLGASFVMGVVALAAAFLVLFVVVGRRHAAHRETP